MLGALGPSGVLFGRAGKMAQQRGFVGGIFNKGEQRVGWSWNNNNGTNWFSIHGGKPKTPGHYHHDLIPGPATIGGQVGGSSVAGGIGANLGAPDCCD